VNLAWDGAGRLKTAMTSAGTYTYTSNGLGQRVAKSGPGVSASYVLGSDAIDAQVLSDGAASYVYAGGLVSEVRGGTSKFYHSDALGTTRAITNSSGSTTDSLTTDAFGMTVSGSGSTPTPFGFAGKAGYQSDPETGLMRLGHRYYDNSTGHFISRDKILDGYNWYAYCGNDPVNSVDATGLWFETAIDVICLIVDLKDFIEEPSIIGGIGLVGDVIGIVVPLLPAPVIGGIIHGIGAVTHLPTPHLPDIPTPHIDPPTHTAIGRMDDLKKYDDVDFVDTWPKSGRIPSRDGGGPVGWPENRRWIDERIERGDGFIIATNPSDLGDYIPGVPNGSFTKREYDYLTVKGIDIWHDY